MYLFSHIYNKTFKFSKKIDVNLDHLVSRLTSMPTGQ